MNSTLNLLMVGGGTLLLMMWFQLSNLQKRLEEKPTTTTIIERVVEQQQPSPPPSPTVRVAIDKNAVSGPETYKQVGYLTHESHMFPLYGSPSRARRGRWYYYTIINDNAIKVPVYYSGRDCMKEVACDEIYDGSKVIVPDFNPTTEFNVKVYGNEVRF